MPESHRTDSYKYNIAVTAHVRRAALPCVLAVIGLLTLRPTTGARQDIAQAPAAQPALEALPPDVRVEPVLSGVDDPVAMAFAPDGRWFFTKRVTGEVQMLAPGNPAPVTIFQVIPEYGVERGLLGITLDPDFGQNHYIYIYYTSDEDHDGRHNRIVRFTLQANGVGGSPLTLLKAPLDSDFTEIHNGGNLHFGPDGKLYASIGDYDNPGHAQDLARLPGKILRLNPANGAGWPGNPWYGSGNANTDRLYARGFRNPFDFDFDPVSGQLFAGDNGTSCDDEVNRVLSGYNYGWRSGYAACEDAAPGGPNPIYNTIPPLVFWSTSVAPAGVTFYRGDAIPEWKHDLFVCHWKTGELHHFKLNRSRTAVAAQSIVAGAVCNLDIETGADGALYFLRNDPSHPGGRLRGIYRITRDATLYASTLSPSSPIPAAGDTLTYTVRLVHYGTLTTTFTLTSSLPPSTTLIDGSLQAGAGTILGSSAGITWTAWITPNTTLVAAYRVSLSEQIAAPTVLTNTMRVSTDRAPAVERVATLIVNGQAVYLPILVRAFEP